MNTIQVDIQIALVCSSCGGPIREVSRKWALDMGEPKHVYFVHPCDTCFKFIPKETRDEPSND